MDCVFAYVHSYEGLNPKAHVIATHVHLESRSYLLLVLQTGKIVYIADHYQSNTTVSTEYSRPENSIYFTSIMGICHV